MAGSPRSVAILGLGLIGGSVARALAQSGGWRTVAWSRSVEGPSRAFAEGVIQAVAADPAEAVAGAALVVLAVPVPASLEMIASLGPAVAAAGAVMTDTGSTKTAVMAAAARVPDLRFIGGHPMSGRETAGYGASEATLFDGRPWVLVPGAGSRPADLEIVEGLVAACGAHPVRLAAAAHDRAVAAISHLPLLASVALASTALEAEDWFIARSLAAQGWRDMTRLARGDPSMGAGILATNAATVAALLRAYRAELEAWQGRLDAAAGGSAAAAAELAERLAHVARALDGS